MIGSGIGLRKKFLIRGDGYFGPLDLLTNPTVAFAISPQRLWGNYSSNIVRLRSDGSGNPESNFLSLSNGNLDIDSINSWKASTGGTNLYGRLYYDQSGNGRDAGKATASAQPVFTAGSLNRGQFTFDGADDCLDTSSWSLAQNFTIWFVADCSSVSSLTYSCGTLGSTPTFGGCYKNGGAPGAYFGSSANHPITSWSTNTLSWSCYHINGASSSLVFNGSASGPLNFGTTSINGGWRVGGRFDATRWGGKIVEMIIFAGDVSSLTGWSDFIANRKAYYSLP